MAVSYADELEIMVAIRDRLRTNLPTIFSEKTCFLCAEPVPPMLPSGDLTLTIFNAGTQYVEGTYMGAGPNALDNQLTIMLTLIVRCATDTPPKSEDILVNQHRGLLQYRRQILNALLVSDTQFCEGYKDQWVPTIDGNEVMRDGGLIPRGWSSPQYDRLGSQLYLASSLTLTLNFDQDL
jgi:hypothetical protein